MTTETYRVIGPPGTGKTEALRKTVEAWIARDGYAPEDIVLTSFTRASAAVLAGRIAVPRENIATLHALAYRALGSPPLAEKGDLAKRWNEGHQNNPEWQVDGGISSEDDGLTMPDAEVGLALRIYSLARMTMLPIAHPYFHQTRDFAEAWEDWKHETGSIDFADMLELALVEAPLLDKPVFIVDEAQDLVPMQWSLVKHWGSRVERLVVAGDPAQVLYSFVGARPDEILTPLEGEHLWPLVQSYRLPRAVQAHAERWLSRHSGPMMAGREYRPRAAEGAVSYSPATWRDPEAVVDAIEQDERDAMVLAPCAYMLQPVIAELRSRGIPFANKYRRSAGNWNPLASVTHRGGGGDTRKSTARMIAAFVDDGEPAEWLPLVRANTFLLRSAKKMIEEGGEPVEGLLRPEHRDAFAARDLRWLQGRMLAEYARAAEYAVEVIQRNGTAVLKQEPRVTIGTFHSVKGGESRRVFLFPDLSFAGSAERYASTAGADAAIRLGYVGLTRASEDLVLCEAADPDRSLW